MPTLDAYRSTLAEVLDDARADAGVPGAVVGVLRGDESTIVASGMANAGTGVEATSDTVFQLGSISKIYTATLVLQLVDAGLVELDEPVRGALQEFRVADDAATLTITPRHLLSHTSGIEGDHFIDCGRNPDALWRYVSTLDEVGQIHAPDDLFSYCNAGFGVLGRLVEEVTGDHFARALERRILRPGGLHRTFTQTDQAIVHRVAAGHHHGDDGRAEVTPWSLARFNAPIGGVLADAADALAFAALHLRAGKNADGRQVVARGAISQLREAQIDVPGGDDSWGLGWQLRTWGDHPVLSHDGDTRGQRAFLRVLPDLDGAVVVLTNSTRGTVVAEPVLRRVAADLFGVDVASVPDPLPVDARPDGSRWNGIYERMHQRLAVAGGPDDTLRMTIIPDELFRVAGMVERTLTLTPIGADRYRVEDPEVGTVTVVSSVDDEDERPSYLHFGGRAHRRIA